MKRSRAIGKMAPELTVATRDHRAGHWQVPTRASTSVSVHFWAFFGDLEKRQVATIERGEIEDWLSGLRFAPPKRNNYRSSISLLFIFSESRGYCERDPIEPTTTAKVIPASPAIFTRRKQPLFCKLPPHLCRKHLPSYAIGPFGEIWVAKVPRLDWRHINVSRFLLKC